MRSNEQKGAGSMGEEVIGGWHPRRKQFETWEVHRPPVAVSSEAQQALNRSSAQGRLFVQALSEVFGTCDDLDALTLDLVQDASGAPGGLCYQVQITRGARTTTLWLAADDLAAQHQSGHPAFAAELAARELLRVDALHRQAG